MTDQQIYIVKKTWRLLRDVDPHLLGDVFYKRLFLKFPSIQPLFKGPIIAQYEKFVAMLNFIVARIDHPEATMSEVASMAKRHEDYGVKPIYYGLVGDALLWTLEQGLGKEWDEEVRQAWQVCYNTLTQTILEKP